MTIKAKKSKINLREKLAELLNFRQIRDRLDGLGLYLGKDRTGTTENLAVRGGANVDDLQLAEISAALGGTAVDVFVYDTRNDSDGGKWRERTQHTSWYNEELNTATRGGRREFPSVAVIVTETDKVTIYDGDDPDMSMWMVFEGQFVGDLKNCKLVSWANNPGQITSCSFLNGLLGIGTGDNGGLIAINFVKDFSRYYRTQDSSYTGAIYSGNISTRNTLNYSWVGDYNEFGIVNDYVNDVSMTVLLNAPIDAETGLPIPTIAVACGSSSNGGFSIINHDGTVASKSYTESAINQSVSFTSDNRLVVSQKRNSNGDVWVAIYDDLTTSTTTTGVVVHDGNISVKYNDVNYLNLPNILSGTTGTIENKYIMSDSGLTLLDQYESSYIGSYVDGNPVNIHGMAAYTTSTYNTGWMPGDIKLATLSDTKIEKVGVDETNSVIDNGESWSGVTDATTEPTGWTLETAGSANYSVASGELTISQTGAANAKIYQSFDVVEGEVYDVEVKYKANSGTARYQVADNAISSGSAIALVDITSASYVTERKTFRAETTGKYSIGISCYGAGASATFDYVTIKQTGELITNGTFDNGTTGWVARSGSSISVSGGRLTAICTGNYDGVQVDSSYLPSLEPGKRYVMSVDVYSITGEVAFGVVSGNTFSGITSPGIYSVTFTASNTTEVWIDNRNSSSSTFVLNSVSIRLAEDDRSVNDNGLQIFGQIDKTPVAPGADLVAYSGFSEDDYLMQPYNSDLDFGTGDFCIMFWQRTSNTTGQEVFFNIGYEASSDYRYVFYRPANTNNLVYYGGHTTKLSLLTVTDALPLNTYNLVVGVRKSGVFTFYVNGQEVGSVNDTLDLTFSGLNRTCKIGVDFDGTDPAEQMALFRISATVPTPEQITKIYRDEKQLFTDGAQATLYGTSDAVTALAYDDKTELLHVGTSDGRSDFAGLRRINNTTTAVTTSISASNNLIAEQ